MAYIKLRDYYMAYDDDVTVEVTEDIAEQFQQWDRDEKAFQKKQTRIGTIRSLNRGDSTESEVIISADTPDKHYERKISLEIIYRALTYLPKKQLRRIFAYYLMEMSMTDIARAEGITRSVVSKSIHRGIEILGDTTKKQ